MLEMLRMLNYTAESAYLGSSEYSQENPGSSMGFENFGISQANSTPLLLSIRTTFVSTCPLLSGIDESLYSAASSFAVFLFLTLQSEIEQDSHTSRSFTEPTAKFTPFGSHICNQQRATENQTELFILRYQFDWQLMSFQST